MFHRLSIALTTSLALLPLSATADATTQLQAVYLTQGVERFDAADGAADSWGNLTQDRDDGGPDLIR
jgi:hypothetical protein